jgi:hypothetical protein
MMVSQYAPSVIMFWIPKNSAQKSSIDGIEPKPHHRERLFAAFFKRIRVMDKLTKLYNVPSNWYTGEKEGHVSDSQNLFIRLPN